MSRAAVIIGASSGIGRAIVRRLAREGFDLVLSGRDGEELGVIARDAEIRHGVHVQTLELDVRDFDRHAAFVDAALEACDGALDGLVLCQGEMPEEARRDFDLARRAIETNYTASVSLLERVAVHLERQGSGWLCAVGSVAGDRGRPGNYLYGSTKAALATFMQGLRARLAKAGVVALTVKPGFVDTGLTWGRPGMFLVASPDRVAEDVWRGISRGRAVIYTPRFWVLVMALIRAIPTRIFDRLSL